MYHWTFNGRLRTAKAPRSSVRWQCCPTYVDCQTISRAVCGRVLIDAALSTIRRSYVSCYLYHFAAGLHVYILTFVLQDIESHYWGNYVVMNGEVFVILASFDPGKCDVFMRDGLSIPA